MDDIGSSLPYALGSAVRSGESLCVFSLTAWLTHTRALFFALTTLVNAAQQQDGGRRTAPMPA
jgi:hypothetical protein